MKRWLVAAFPLLLTGLLGALILSKPGRAPTAAPGSGGVTPARESGSYREVVKKIVPAVVSLEAKSKPKKGGGVRRRNDDNIDQPRSLPDAPDDGDDNPQFGSGFIIDPKGVVATNFHVVEGADQVEVQLVDGRKFLSTEIKTDPKTDIAIVRFSARGHIPFLEFGDSDEMEIGDGVLAVGAPFGLTGSVTHGIVSGKGRSLKMNLYEDYLQTDAAINPGNSGGPLVNLEGKVIGINAAIKTKTGGFQGVGLAVSSNLAKNVTAQLLKDGSVRRGYLGVQMKELIDREVAERLGVGDRGGVIASAVFPGTPAARAGLQDGDVIVGIDGKPIRDGRALQTVVAGLAPGATAGFRFVRDGKVGDAKVTIEEQPKELNVPRVPAPRPPRNIPEGIAADRVGISLTDLTAELAEGLGFRDGMKGALIVRVKRDGIGSEASLQPGVVITKVDHQPVRTALECKELLAKAKLDEGALVQVQTPQSGATFVILRENK
jgi:serine protease Do